MVHLSDKSRVEHYLALAGRPPLSAYSFVYIYVWRDFFDFHLEMIDECLCVFAENPLACFLYLSPLGLLPQRETWEACQAFMEQKNSDPQASRFENVSLSQLSSLSGRECVAERRSQEYIYSAQKIADLTGQEYRSQRALYHHFTRNYSARYLPFHPEMTEECLALYRAWATVRREKCTEELFGFMLDDNLTVHRRVMESHAQLGVMGRVVTVDGKIKAYTIGYPLNEEVFCVFLEIADVSVKGLPVFIFREFSAEIGAQGFRLVNAMDDFGLPNLTQTKMSYRPVALCPVYTVKMRAADYIL